MNGQLPCPFQKLSLPNALLASCLLHLGFMMLPYWGVRIETLGVFDRATSAVSTHALNVTLMPHRADSQTADQSRVEAANPTTTPPPTQAPDAASAQTSAATSSYAEHNILPLSAPRFYPSEQLTHSPVPLEFKDLDSPETSDIIASGQMTIKLWIDERGKVVYSMVEKTSLPVKIVESVVARFQQMRFTPGERYGEAVGSFMTIEVNFDDGRQPKTP